MHTITKKQSAPRVLWLWIFGSGIGASIGAVLGLILFPGAAFGINPTGHFGWHLVGFASTVGFLFGSLQWLILRYAPRYRKVVSTPFLVLWIPVSCIGITVMMLPLWFLHARAISNAPWQIVIPMLPGMALLGLGQWAFLYGRVAKSFNWIPYTIIGAMIGAILGLVISMFLPMPIEATWAFVTAAGIGFFQGFALAPDVDTNLSTQDQLATEMRSGQQMPHYRFRVILLVIATLLIAHILLTFYSDYYREVGIFIEATQLVIFFPIVTIIMTVWLLVDLLRNGRLLFSNTSPGRRTLGRIILSVEILLFFASFYISGISILITSAFP